LALAYRPDLDGLRAVSIGLVLATHGGLATNAGQAGVTAFFVLSGYLITSLLLIDGHIRAFYGRRIRRLAPAFAAMLAGVTVLGLLGVWHGAWPASVGLALSEVGNNATALGLPDTLPASHAWSLNIEEQFYLVWPLILSLVAPRRLVAPAIVLIVAATVLRLAGLDVHATPVRFDAILVGCVVAVRGWTFPRPLGWIGFALVVSAGLIPNTGAAITEAMLGAALVVGSRLPIGGLAPVGKRAYSLYLWSWPLTIWLGGQLGLVATIAVAELSYRFVERRWLEAGPRRSRPEVPLERARRDLGHLDRLVRPGRAVRVADDMDRGGAG
jgi:peptidoglycan/LPS O-acetylase OafA/YrhL